MLYRVGNHFPNPSFVEGLLFSYVVIEKKFKYLYKIIGSLKSVGIKKNVKCNWKFIMHCVRCTSLLYNVCVNIEYVH